MKMNKIIGAVIVLILASCASSHDVVRSGFLQKRKYKKGYHLSFKKANKKDENKLVEEALEGKKKGFKSRIEAENVSVSNEEVELVASVDEESIIKVVTVLEKSHKMLVVDSIEEVKSLTIHNSKAQKSKMIRARVFRGVGLGIAIFVSTLPFTYVLFLLSLKSLINYAKNREVEGADLGENNLRVKVELAKVKKLSKYHYLLIGFGVLMATLSLLFLNVTEYGGSELSVMSGIFMGLGLVALIFFLIVFVALVIRYFRLFYMVKKEDKIGRKYKVSED